MTKFSFLLLLTALMASGCSSVVEKRECNNDDFLAVGKQAFLSGNPDVYIGEFQLKCSTPLSSESISNFMKGLKMAKFGQCTGLSDFNPDQWEILGKEVALRGDTENTYLSFKDNCQLTPSASQLKDYTQGYKKGLTSLCSKLGGVEFERRGLSYKNTCDKKSQKAFEAGRIVGKKFKYVDDRKNEIKTLTEKGEKILDDNRELEIKISECRKQLENLEKNQKSDYFAGCSFPDSVNVNNRLLSLQDDIKKNSGEVSRINSSIALKKSEIEFMLREIEVLESVAR